MPPSQLNHVLTCFAHTAMILCSVYWTRRPWPKTINNLRSVSYEKQTLTLEAIKQRITSSLGEGYDGKPLHIDIGAKTVSTTAGPLPLSPVLQPAWIKTRRRQKKDDPGKVQGRFRKKLANNPYARALATPLRSCNITGVTLPRFFFQDFEVVKHPDTGLPWWAPGPLALDSAKGMPRKPKTRGDESSQKHTSNQEIDTSYNLDQVVDSQPIFDQGMMKLAPSASQPVNGTVDEPVQRPYRAPITCYALGRKSLIDLMGLPKSRFSTLLISRRSGMAVNQESRSTVWRQDMGDFLLVLLQRRATDALIACSLSQRPEGRLVCPKEDWGEVRDVKLRGCVLWLPEGKDVVGEYATLDIEGVQYAKKMAVHNLFWLLGNEQVERLKRESPMFCHSEILVLLQSKSPYVMGLHLLLWRLQGYLATLQSSRTLMEMI